MCGNKVRWPHEHYNCCAICSKELKAAIKPKHKVDICNKCYVILHKLGHSYISPTDLCMSLLSNLSKEQLRLWLAVTRYKVCQEINVLDAYIQRIGFIKVETVHEPRTVTIKLGDGRTETYDDPFHTRTIKTLVL